ncbi:prepilin-type N-terminal cleavage/methylation domain-containing protein [Planctomycetota bacterium]
MSFELLNTRYTIRNTQYGFTIVEVLIVVVLVALLASVGGGIYVGTYKNMLVKKAARDLLLSAKYARILAIEEQSRCSIQLDVENNGFVVTIEKAGEDGEENEQVIVKNSYCRPVEFGGNVKFEVIQIKPVNPMDLLDIGKQNVIVFSPDGTSQTAVIQIGDGNNHMTVQVTAATGKAKLYARLAEEVKTRTIDLDNQRLGYGI